MKGLGWSNRLENFHTGGSHPLLSTPHIPMIGGASGGPHSLSEWYSMRDNCTWARPYICLLLCGGDHMLIAGLTCKYNHLHFLMHQKGSRAASPFIQIFHPIFIPARSCYTLTQFLKLGNVRQEAMHEIDLLVENPMTEKGSNCIGYEGTIQSWPLFDQEIPCGVHYSH